MDDWQIIELFWKRSPKAIEKITEKYQRLICSVIRNIVGNESDVQECENDTYLALWNSIPPNRPYSLLHYTCRLAKNIAYNRYDYCTRKKRCAALVALDELADDLSTLSLEEEWSNRQLGQAINRFLGQLDQENRVIFVRRYWYGQAEQEIAEKLELSRNSVALRLSRTRKKLKLYLQKEGVYEA